MRERWEEGGLHGGDDLALCSCTRTSMSVRGIATVKYSKLGKSHGIVLSVTRNFRLDEAAVYTAGLAIGC